MKLYGDKIHYNSKGKPYCNNSWCRHNPTLVDVIDQVTCKNCIRRYKEEMETQLQIIDSVVCNKTMGSDEIFQTIEAASVDYKRMSERCRAIDYICTLVMCKFFSKEELIERFKEAIVKSTMDE